MDSEKINDKVWHYLHGLLSAPERAAFESRLQSDPALRARLADARQLDNTLKSVSPYVDWSEEQLEDKVLSAWEADQPRAATQPRLFTADRSAWRPFPQALLGLAAALCLLLAGSGVFLNLGFTAWSDPVITLPAYRGASTDAADAAQRKELAALSRQFENTIERAYRSARGGRAAWESLRARREWRMGLQIQTFRQGVLSVHVQAVHRTAPDLKLEWTEYFSDPDAFRTEQERMGAAIANALAAAVPR